MIRVPESPADSADPTPRLRPRPHSSTKTAQKVINDAQREIERHKREVRMAEERDHITSAVVEMLREGKITNYQREGLLLLVARSSIKIPDEAKL